MLLFKIIIFFVVFLVTECTPVSDSQISYALSDEFINAINSRQSLWTAGRNFDRRTPVSYIRSLAGTIIDNNVELPVKNYHFKSKLPQSFYSGNKWSGCRSIKEIRDQGSCSSCWAVSVASVMTDRTCIFLKEKFHVSAQDILSCCRSCWGSGTGCENGKVLNAYLFYNNTGVVSGGNYQSYTGCRPYEIPPCQHNGVGKRKKPCKKNKNTPECKTKCDIHYNKKYYRDKIRSKQVYVAKNDVEDIQYEIYKNGPVSATILLYTDFLSYKSGIYKHDSGDILGYHSVRLVGWGVAKNITYWLAANSWNREWGDNGYFKIISGSNHCQIEEHVSFGYP